MKLKDLRRNIDGMNTEMASMVAKRMGMARMIAVYKRDAGLPIIDADREKRVIADMEQEFVLHGMRPETGRIIARALIDAAVEEERAISKTA